MGRNLKILVLKENFVLCNDNKKKSIMYVKGHSMQENTQKGKFSPRKYLLVLFPVHGSPCKL